MKIMNISKELLDECLSIAHTYTYETRHWERGTYNIDFSHIDTQKNVAVFGVISHKAIKENRERFDASNGNWSGWHPEEEFTLLIDIVDKVVLSENEPDTVFPNEIK